MPVVQVLVTVQDRTDSQAGKKQNRSLAGSVHVKDDKQSNQYETIEPAVFFYKTGTNQDLNRGKPGSQHSCKLEGEGQEGN